MLSNLDLFGIFNFGKVTVSRVSIVCLNQYLAILPYTILYEVIYTAIDELQARSETCNQRKKEDTVASTTGKKIFRSCRMCQDRIPNYLTLTWITKGNKWIYYYPPATGYDNIYSIPCPSLNGRSRLKYILIPLGISQAPKNISSLTG